MAEPRKSYYQRWMAIPKNKRIYIGVFTMALACAGDYVCERLWEEKDAREEARERLEANQLRRELAGASAQTSKTSLQEDR
ncbi:hypothetical protein JA1_002528 [Spathaspora sp. JA1]|nr:hypothetical protein JA1_002528 [Spathaspora sp. JA1]